MLTSSPHSLLLRRTRSEAQGVAIIGKLFPSGDGGMKWDGHSVPSPPHLLQEYVRTSFYLAWTPQLSAAHLHSFIAAGSPGAGVSYLHPQSGANAHNERLGAPARCQARHNPQHWCVARKGRGAERAPTQATCRCRSRCCQTLASPCFFMTPL